MSDYITPINVPSLSSPTFASDLSRAFTNINDNFKRLASAPYLEGQEGWSIDTVEMEIVHDGDLTDFGRGMAQAIFSNSSIRHLADIDQIAQPINSYKASDYFRLQPTVTVFGKWSPDTGQIEDYVCASEYYLFLDMRVSGLGTAQYPSNYGSQFYDYTCQVFCRYVDGVWQFSKGIMLPTLYYDSSQNYFCWKINDMSTGIRAQGPKGDDGRPPMSAVVKGIGYSNGSQTQITVQKFWNGTSWVPASMSGLGNGDMVCCVFDITDSSTGITHPDMVIANIEIPTGRDWFKITVSDSARLSQLCKSYMLFYSMRSVDYMASDGNTLKAVFVPAANDGIVHAVFQDDSTVEYGEGTVTDTDKKDNLTIKKSSISRVIGPDSIGNENRMTSPDSSDRVSSVTDLNVVGYRAHANVNGVEGVTLGVPVGCVMSWIDEKNIPDGWFLTGEVTDNIDPVFGLRPARTGETIDVVFTKGTATVSQMTLCTMQGTQFGTQESRFIGIFCTMTGNTPTAQNGIPTTVDIGSFSTVKQYLDNRWTQFDYSSIGNGFAFKLTKYIG